MRLLENIMGESHCQMSHYQRKKWQKFMQFMTHYMLHIISSEESDGIHRTEPLEPFFFFYVLASLKTLFLS